MTLRRVRLGTGWLVTNPRSFPHARADNCLRARVGNFVDWSRASRSPVERGEVSFFEHINCIPENQSLESGLLFRIGDVGFQLRALVCVPSLMSRPVGSADRLHGVKSFTVMSFTKTAPT